MTRLALLAISALGLIQTPPTVTQADKVLAMHNPICTLPIGQTIDAAELPADALEPANWMARLDSSLPISLVSIPASHDAGTALGTFGWSRCTVFTIPAQLQLGIRGFDVRLRLVDGALKVYHNDEYEKLDFSAVMSAFSSFLHKNPSEFIVMRIRQENDTQDKSGSFEAAFGQVQKQYRGLFFRATSRTQIPTVGQLRGKILVLDNYGKLSNAIDYPNPTMVVQDDYDTNDMDKKFSEIVENMTAAQQATDGKLWYVNYTSSSTDQVDQLMNAVRVNPRVEAHLRGIKGHLGLVLMNFPGIDAIHEIVDSNFR